MGNLLDRLPLSPVPPTLRANVPLPRDRREDHGREHGRVPGSEGLRAVLLPHRFLDVLVDLLGADIPPSVSVAVGQKLVATAAALAKRPYQADDRPVSHDLNPALTPLPLVVEGHRAIADGDVPLAHRCDAERLVLLRVVLGSDSEEPAVEQTGGAGKHPLA